MSRAPLVTPSENAAFARLSPIAPTDVVLAPRGYLADRIDANLSRSIPEGLRRLEEWGALPYLRAAATRSGPPELRPYNDRHLPKILDSDIFKWLEAVATEHAHRPVTAGLRKAASEIIDLVLTSQHDDGALNSWTTAHGIRPLEDWTDGHEVYCGGHLVQAAIAWRRATGDERLLAAAERWTSFVARAVAVEPRLMAQHPGLEMALVELARETGDRRHLDLAVELLDRRGHDLIGSWRFSPEHFVDHVPLRELTVMNGHAVMALFLACGMVDAAVETGDDALLAAAIAQWDDMVEHKLSLTGGVGARQFDEAFGGAYELAPDTAYNETCAAVGTVMLSWRLLLATGDPRYADLIERVMHNGMLSGAALDGEGYLYSNPLHVRRAGGILSPGGYTHRADWFECACCPPNLMRAVSAVGELVVTTDGDGLQVHQYVPGRFGSVRAIAIATDLPHGDGVVEVGIAATDDEPWTLSIRRAPWMRDLVLDASWGPADVEETDGMLGMRRVWRAGDRVTLRTTLEVRPVTAHPRATALHGQVAFERGPVVLCLEEPDVNEDIDLDDVLLGAAASFSRGVEALPGVPSYRVGASLRRDRGSLYRSDSEELPAEPLDLRLVPYAAWGNRGACRMKVWLPQG